MSPKSRVTGRVGAEEKAKHHKPTPASTPDTYLNQLMRQVGNRAVQRVLNQMGEEQETRAMPLSAKTQARLSPNPAETSAAGSTVQRSGADDYAFDEEAFPSYGEEENNSGVDLDNPSSLKYDNPVNLEGVPGTVYTDEPLPVAPDQASIDYDGSDQNTPGTSSGDQVTGYPAGGSQGYEQPSGGGESQGYEGNEDVTDTEQPNTFDPSSQDFGPDLEHYGSGDYNVPINVEGAAGPLYVKKPLPKEQEQVY